MFNHLLSVDCFASAYLAVIQTLGRKLAEFVRKF